MVFEEINYVSELCKQNLMKAAKPLLWIESIIIVMNISY